MFYRQSSTNILGQLARLEENSLKSSSMPLVLVSIFQDDLNLQYEFFEHGSFCC